MKTPLDSNSTITAISTPAGPGGIGIIRISGDKALEIARSIFKRTGTGHGKLFESHKLLLGNIINPANGQVIDEVLLSFMKAPRSYTTEDIIEINAHSGAVVLNTMLELVLKSGARLAEPGEFTKRAFLNGRVDLTQAEAIADIIQSKTQKALDIAVSQAGGFLGKRVESILIALQDSLVSLEAAIDFPEDMEDDLDRENLVKAIEEATLEINGLIDLYNEGSVIREGQRICITGKPNVGKSSLLNCLVRNDRAIVTHIPGTTRDVVEEVIDIGGMPVFISDTAGLHDTDDPVEVIGMSKTRDYIEKSDMILFMIDASTGVDKDDIDIFKKISKKKVIIIINKSDLVDEDFIPVSPDNWKGIPSIKISALYEKGVSGLRELIKEISMGQSEGLESALIPNLRQKYALERSLRGVREAITGLNDGLTEELVSMDIKEAVNGLEEILGISTEQDVLGEIFSRFCIGK